MIENETKIVDQSILHLNEERKSNSIINTHFEQNKVMKFNNQIQEYASFETPDFSNPDIKFVLISELSFGLGFNQRIHSTDRQSGILEE